MALVTLAIFAAVAVWRLGAFDLSRRIDAIDVPNQHIFVTFAGVDHPFHATRAYTLLQSLAEGRIPRWIATHQGGYPAEFYPLGGAWLDVVAWSALLGAVPIVVVHKLVIIAVFLAPLAAFLWSARLDGLPSTVAVTAGAAHIAMPGGSFAGGAYSGGYRELVGWGLFTNVTAATETLLVLPALLLFTWKGRSWAGAAAASGAALAVVTNPRSSIALVAVGIGVAAALGLHTGRQYWTRALLRLATVALTAGLLAAPLLVSLIRYGDLYHFVRYSSYDALGDYLSASIATSSLPVIVLAFIGAGWAYASPRHVATKATTLAVLIYVLITASLVATGEPNGPFQQLELTRLMPFQRLALLYLAGVGIHAIATGVLGGSRRNPAPRLAEIAIAIAVFVGFVVAPFGGRSSEEQGLFEVPTTASASMLSLRAAIERADEVAPAGSTIYVVGSALSWHQQLWSPLWTERSLRYNDWLWSWQPSHQAPGYVEDDGNAYNPTTVLHTLDQDYLTQEGIGAVVLTSSNHAAWADASPALRLVSGGLYRVYEVVEPATVVTVESGTVENLTVNDQRITARGTASGGPVRVRVNWFPRWQAAVNGRSSPIERTPDGYMAVDVPNGEFELVLVYSTTWWDWLARATSITGVVLLLGLVAHPIRRIRSIRSRTGSAHR